MDTQSPRYRTNALLGHAIYEPEYAAMQQGEEDTKSRFRRAASLLAVSQYYMVLFLGGEGTKRAASLENISWLLIWPYATERQTSADLLAST